MHLPPNSATPGVDYVALSGVAIIPAHKSSVQVRVQAFLDAVAEGRETVQVDLAENPAYVIDTVHPSASMSITNVFAIDTTAAFGDSPNAYTSTFRTTYRGVSQPKIISNADATFPLDLLGFGAAARGAGNSSSWTGRRDPPACFWMRCSSSRRATRPRTT